MGMIKKIIKNSIIVIFGILTILGSNDDTSPPVSPAGKNIPVANAGTDQNVDAGTTVTLDGSKSSDADNDTLTYQWRFVSKPAGSNASFFDKSVINPRFVADISGNYVIELIVNDGSTNSSADTVTVTANADTTVPNIVVNNPNNGATITDVTQALSYKVSDDKSGIKENTLLVKINNVNKTALAKLDGDKITITPDVANYWQAGVLGIVIEITDKAGNKASASFSYTVQANTTALPVAKPASGNAPLTVQLFPFNTTSTAIESYEWDYNGDGSYDVRETVGRNQTYTFNTPGTYTIALKLVDSEGKEVIGTTDVTVNNQKPVVSAEASPSNGSVPLTVNFSASAVDNEGINLYEWDFEGDGSYDKSGSNTSSASHTYSVEGTFQPILQVSDNLGAKTTYAFSDIEVRVKPGGSPSVTAQASPTSGDAPLAVSFSATASADGSRTVTKWEWDYDGDGTYDSNSDTTGSSSYSYTTAGQYFAKIRVTDSDNQNSEDVIKITVNPTLSLSRSVDTIDTNANEKVTINTNLGGDTTMALLIEDRYGNTVKTLVAKGVRSAGTYADEWAGDDDNGVTVGEGDYRAVILYDVNGVEKRLDLSTSTGGSSYNPPRTGIPSNFKPFAGNPLVIDFTLNTASEVTAFMGRFNVDTRLITFMQRRPLGKGTHRITWNGEDSTGQLIHPPSGDSFLFGIFGYYLPDNSIYVRSGATIQNLTLSPSILVPDSVTNSVSKLSFNLTNNADVRLTVYNADKGKLVASKTFTGLSAGANEVTWDGKNNQNIFVAPGKYRLGLTAIDSTGYQSITYYAVQQVYY